MGRMLTTMLPDILPAGSHAMFVMYMLTLRPCVLWRISMPASMSSLSKLNEQPMRNATKSSRHKSSTLVGSSTITPSR